MREGSGWRRGVRKWQDDRVLGTGRLVAELLVEVLDTEQGRERRIALSHLLNRCLHHAAGVAPVAKLLLGADSADTVHPHHRRADPHQHRHDHDPTDLPPVKLEKHVARAAGMVDDDDP